MNNMPLVTIVTPSFNQGSFIRNTINSVLSQDYPNIEYLIIDGGSTDDTLDILKEFKGKLTWISEKDEGQSDAINKGFKMAKGEIVAWLNSDDTYEPGAIRAAVEAFLENKEIGLVYGDGDIIDQYGNKVKRFEATQQFDLWTLIHVWDYIMQPTTFFKKETLEKVGYLDKSLHWCMDWDLWIRIGANYKVRYIEKVLANSREYADTKTSTGGFKRFFELVKLMRKYGELKYSPGYFLYGSSTLVSLSEGIPVVNLLTKSIAYSIQKFVFNKLPIVYKDGWMGRKAIFMIPAFAKKVTFYGEVIFNEVLPLNITFYKGNKFLKKYKVESSGEFQFDIIMPSAKTNVLYNNITIYADKHIVPSKLYKNSQETRKLSILISVMY